MLHNVLFEITSLSGFIIALVARIWLLSRVFHNVVFELTSLSGCIIAMDAFVQFLATVN